MKASVFFVLLPALALAPSLAWADTQKPTQPAAASKADDDITATALSAPAEKLKPEAKASASGDVDIPQLEPAKNQSTTALLPTDPTAGPLPGAKPVDMDGTPLLWKDVPLDGAIGQLARLHGAQIVLTDLGAEKRTISGDYRGLSINDALRRISINQHLSMSVADGHYSLSPAVSSASLRAERQPVIASRTYSFPSRANAEFVALAKSHQSKFTFLRQTEDRVWYRINDTPDNLQAYEQAVANIEVRYAESPLTYTGKLAKERAKLQGTRTKLVDQFISQK
jgi:hypothetical protein